jgi:hypothetical protein
MKSKSVVFYSNHPDYRSEVGITPRFYISGYASATVTAKLIAAYKLFGLFSVGEFSGELTGKGARRCLYRCRADRQSDLARQRFAGQLCHCWNHPFGREINFQLEWEYERKFAQEGSHEN